MQFKTRVSKFSWQTNGKNDEVPSFLIEGIKYLSLTNQILEDYLQYIIRNVNYVQVFQLRAKLQKSNTKLLIHFEMFESQRSQSQRW
jgi:hypothetical protein